MNSLRFLNWSLKPVSRLPLSDCHRFSSTVGGVKRKWLSPNGFLYKIVVPVEVDPSVRLVPDFIEKPDYAPINFSINKSYIEKVPRKAEIHGHETINRISESCRLAKLVLEEASQAVKPGIDCQFIDDVVYDTCMKLRCYPSPLNYKGFPKSVTTSVNNVAVHGIPDKRVLEEGDIVTVDVSVFHNGYHGDTAATFPVGKVDQDALKLIAVSRKCLEEAIKLCASGTQIKKIGKIIEQIAVAHDLNTVPSLCGHGVGTYFHGPPLVLHYDTSNSEWEEETLMVENMVFTIEPVICEGQVDVLLLQDGWTLATADNSRCAQFEHTILITSGEPRILT